MDEDGVSESEDRTYLPRAGEMRQDAGWRLGESLGIRAFAWFVSTTMCLLYVLAAPDVAYAEEPSPGDRCKSTELAGAKVATAVRLEHDSHTYTKVVTELTVDVPSAWPLRHDLLLGEGSRRYITAMSCLSRDTSQETGYKVDDRWSEWRTAHPSVTSKGSRVRVVYDAYGWVDNSSLTEVGLWRIEPVDTGEWSLELIVPPALRGARWSEISVDPGRPGAQKADPEPERGDGATALVWRPGRVAEAKERAVAATPEELGVTVTTRPPWQRSWAAQGDQLPAVGLNLLGSVLWNSAMSALLLSAVRRYRRRPVVPTNTQSRNLRNLRLWALIAIPLSLLSQAEGLINGYLARLDRQLSFDEQLVTQHSLAMVCVVLLLGFARPTWRIRWAAAGAGLVSLAATVLLCTLVASPSIYFVSDKRYGALETGLVLQFVASFSLVTLLLLAFLAAAWRLASDGGILPRSRRHPGRNRELTLRIALPAVLVATALMALHFGLAEELNWQRASWLSSPVDPEFGADHRADHFWTAMWSVSFISSWLIGSYGWLLTTVAVVAVFRTCSDGASLSPMHEPADRLLLLTFVPLAISLTIQIHLGSALLTSLAIPLYMLALYAVTAVFARRSVLAQPFEVSRRPLAAEVGPLARAKLLAKARSYREIHAELRRLDQGLFGDAPPERALLEQQLERLHDWDALSVPGTDPERLPATESVVDAALALGPRDNWWGNGVRGARFALLPGLLAALFNTWADWIRGEAWRNTLSDLTGLPGLVMALVTWMTTFTGAGFALGALWRVLPGRRGASKAIPVAVAFAAPVALDGLVGWFTREGATNLALQIATMLFVLTITSIALDLDTFRGERRYWQSRLGLLLSVYQMRYYSLQVAYLIGQVIAIITIWQFFAEPDAVPSQNDVPPPETP